MCLCVVCVCVSVSASSDVLLRATKISIRVQSGLLCCCCVSVTASVHQYVRMCVDDGQLRQTMQNMIPLSTCVYALPPPHC